MISGTELEGITATSKTIRVRGVQISKLRDGLIVERSRRSEEPGILKQLGQISAWPDSKIEIQSEGGQRHQRALAPV